PVGGVHDIQIHRLRPPPLPPAVEFQIPTAGGAEAVVLRDGLAYVADGAAGLQVLRFQDADRAGRPPTVTLSSSTGSETAQENQRVTVTAQAVDDVAVARVEFLVDGELAATDAFFPFEHTVVMPLRGQGHDRIRFQARAVDTGGNAGVSEELVLSLEEDRDPPWGNQTWPDNRSEIEDNGPPVQTLTVRLSEPFDPASFRPELFRLIEAGADGWLNTPDDVVIAGAIPELRGTEGILRFHLPAALPQGGYRATLAEGLADRRGNRMDYDHVWNFRVVGPWVVANRPRSFGAWAGHAVRLWFNRPMDPASLTRAITAAYWRSGGVLDP
ncbi:MAG TPA: Ig-like domain-containing protein, partial [Verrucomicrobiota bacterium]|nr:Ig-like domain-containing protein [Verrucomicrobiota bacterium]